MKVFYLLILAGMLLLVPVTKTCAQNKLNLQEIFDKKLQKRSVENYSGKTDGQIESAKVQMKNKTGTLYGIMFALLELSLIAMLVYKWKERTATVNTMPETELKNNIEKIRLEKIIRRNNEEIELLRKKLGEGKIKLDVTRSNLTRKAKELSLSKGEIYLAAKLKLLAGK